jgi:DNA polymerase type B, organellar and viral
MSSVINNNGVKFENDKFQIVKEQKKLANVLYFDCKEFMDLELFMQKLFMLEFGYTYTILLRVSYLDKSGDNSEWKSLGEQIVVKDLNSNSFKITVGNLHRTILSRLESSMDKYGYDEMSVVGFQMIIYKTGMDIVNKKHKINKSSFGENRDLVNMSDLTESVNKIYPITNVRYNYGVMLEKKIVNDCIEYITLLDGSKINFQSCINQYSNKHKLNSNMNFYQKLDKLNNIFVVDNLDSSTQSINVFDISGMWIQHVVEKDIDSNSFSRQIGNVRFYVNKSGIYKKDIYMDFPHIYPNKVTKWLNKLNHPNYKIGTIDIETYNVGKNISYAYAIGFYTEGNLKCFYIDKNINSDSLIIKCLEAMLIEKYNGYTFYAHNLREFDIYYILHALIKLDKIYPDKFQFKENIVWRDNKIISLKVSTKINGNTYSIKFLDSLLLLQSSLDNLCRTFDTDVKKTYFPYAFVNKHNLWYIGNKPDLKYYKDIITKSIEEDNENMDECKKYSIIIEQII